MTLQSVWSSQFNAFGQAETWKLEFIIKMHHGFQAVVDDQGIVLFISASHSSIWTQLFSGCHIYQLSTN